MLSLGTRRKAQEETGASVPSAAPNQGTAQEKPSQNPERMDDLKRWLNGDENGLLDWLSEPDNGSTIVGQQVTPTETVEVADVRRKADSYEAELQQLKEAILETLKGESAGMKQRDLSALEEKLESVAEQGSMLREQVYALAKYDQDVRQEFEEAMAGLPKDQEELVKARVLLAGRESAFESEQKSVFSGPIEEGAQSGDELTQRFHAELREKESDFSEREREHKSKIDYLAEELKTKTLELQQRDDELRILRSNGKGGTAALDDKVREVQLKEKRIRLMEEEIERLKTEVRERDDELKKIREVIGYKEQEMLRREEDLDYREKLLVTDKAKFDTTKRETQGVEEVELKQRLEHLKAEVSLKEEELISKEKFLNAKAEELRLREHGVIEDEIQKREEERGLEVRVAKVKTGNARFDDLLLGGIPFGSNVLVHGPPFVGKEVMIGQFVSEGLRKGVPTLWVITDKTPRDVREEMKAILSGYEEYERLGLVHYIDAYSKSMGEAADDPYTTYIAEPTNHDGIMEATEKKTKEFKEKHKYYRLAFRSLSTLIAYSDMNTAFRFLSPFCGRRKRDGAVSMYAIEKGVHGEQEIQMLGSIMDGMIDFKLDQLKTYFSVQGVCDVQSRSYIRYTVGKHGLSIGSFSLDHIR